jgi:protein SCO1/2
MTNSALRLILLLALLLSACAPAAQLKGTDLGKTPAPNFSLVDQNGRPVSLSDLQGQVVVLTFLYTHCPDECPLTAENLHATSEQLGDLMNQVTFVAISVDPKNDTPEAIQAFIHEHRLDGQLRYLSGTREQLAPVWTAYYISVQPEANTSTGASVLHGTRVVVIDKTGHERVNFDSDFQPADLAFDLRMLIAEKD